MRVDRVDDALELRCEEVAQDLAADRPAPARGADHGDRVRLQEASDRGDRGDPLALLEPLACARSESEVGSSIAIASGVERMSTGKPLSRNTSIIRWLCGSTSAVNVVIPCYSAMPARWASRIVAMPCPCHASATRNATSAAVAAGADVGGMGDDRTARR